MDGTSKLQMSGSGSEEFGICDLRKTEHLVITMITCGFTRSPGYEGQYRLVLSGHIC